MTRQHIARQAAQNQLDAYNTGDIEAFVACYHPDVVWYDLLSGEQQGTGHHTLREGYGALFKRYPNLHAEITSRRVVGHVVFDHETVTGRGPETLEAMAIYDVGEDGLIHKIWFVIDRS